MKEQIRKYEIYAEQKNIIIEFFGEPDFNAEFDPKRMEEVFSNLLDNAIKYSPRGSTVKFYVYTLDGFAEIKIVDEGPGIKKDELKFLFTLFSNTKMSNRPTEGESSTGLGLAICKKIISLHDGQINVSSQENKGSTFIVRLPLRQN